MEIYSVHSPLEQRFSTLEKQSNIGARQNFSGSRNEKNYINII